MLYLKYFILAILHIPLLPVMLYQELHIRKRITVFPEASEPSGSVDKELSKEINILILGESTMAGVGVDKHINGFAGRFAHHFSEITGVNVKWQVIAKSGFTIKQITNELVPQIPGENFDLILVGTGANDTFTLNTPWGWKRNIKRFINSIRKTQADTPLVFINLPPVREFPALTSLLQFALGRLISIFNEVLISVSNKHDNVYFNSEPIRVDEWIATDNSELSTDDFFSDGVHPSGLCYDLWAQGMARYSEELMS
ncbi:MAG: SGNH/GDSL hydrolase family protein [Bacteroidia bacterium]|nr:SGNH/GDSL hydrolase family protein [Bacteroidia bacterium]MBT8229924.1 SGNH/GDSL hydrolase family protein [Bacteroidia bacterium]NNK90034.1 SGNH/GDSL hydrolase family protein [Saprospiraceae bacterium]